MLQCAAHPDMFIPHMQALVNGKTAELADGTTVADLVRELGLADRRIAVELNGEILPRSRHGARIIVADDVLEIVHAIGGGAAIEKTFRADSH